MWSKQLDKAPRDGTIVNVVGRYRDATAGFPRYAGFRDGKWWEHSRFAPQELVVWAWRPRDAWPSEDWGRFIDPQPYTSQPMGVNTFSHEFIAAGDSVGGEQ